MDGVSIWHWLIVIGAVAAIWACAQILKRIGISGWWVLLGLLWPVNIIGLVILARAKWPVEERVQ